MAGKEKGKPEMHLMPVQRRLRKEGPPGCIISPCCVRQGVELWTRTFYHKKRR